MVFRNVWLKITISNGKNWNLLGNLEIFYRLLRGQKLKLKKILLLNHFGISRIKSRSLNKTSVD